MLTLFKGSKCVSHRFWVVRDENISLPAEGLIGLDWLQAHKCLLHLERGTLVAKGGLTARLQPAKATYACKINNIAIQAMIQVDGTGRPIIAQSHTIMAEIAAKGPPRPRGQSQAQDHTRLTMWFPHKVTIPARTEYWCKARTNAPVGGSYLTTQYGNRQCLVGMYLVTPGSDQSIAFSILNSSEVDHTYQPGQTVAELRAVEPVGQGAGSNPGPHCIDSSSEPGNPLVGGLISDWQRTDPSLFQDSGIPDADTDQSKTAVDLIDSVNLSHLDQNQSDQLKEVLLKHSALFDPSSFQGAPSFRVPIPLIDDIPVNIRQYPMAKSHEDFMKKHVKEMEKLDIVERSQSLYNLPFILVRKDTPPGQSQNFRWVLDARKLNEKIVSDISVPIPKINEALKSLAFKKIFTTLDLSNGFFNLLVKEEDRHKLSFTVPGGGGKWQLKRMAQGIKSSTMLFTSFIDNLLAEYLGIQCLTYVDDIILFSDNFENHLVDIDKILTKLESENLRLNPKKCEFAKREVKYLGFRVNKQGYYPDPKKTDALKKLNELKSQKEIKQFLGTVTFFASHIKRLWQKAEPLAALLRKDVEFKWGPEQQEAFDYLKNCLIKEPVVLHWPDFNQQFILHTDASTYGISGILSQMRNNKLCVLEYFSKLLNKAQRNYSVLEKEGLALTESCKQFYHYLADTKIPFLAFTDNRALSFLQSFKDPTSRIARWCIFLSQFNMIVQDIRGTDNSCADFFSRVFPNIVLEDSKQMTTNLKNVVKFSPNVSHLQLDESQGESSATYAGAESKEPNSHLGSEAARRLLPQELVCTNTSNSILHTALLSENMASLLEPVKTWVKNNGALSQSLSHYFQNDDGSTSLQHCTISSLSEEEKLMGIMHTMVQPNSHNRECLSRNRMVKPMAEPMVEPIHSQQESRQATAQHSQPVVQSEWQQLEMEYLINTISNNETETNTGDENDYEDIPELIPYIWDTDALKIDQSRDKFCQNVLANINSGKEYKNFKVNKEGLLTKLLNEKELLVIPTVARKGVMLASHDIPTSGHYAAQSTLNRIQQFYWWPSMADDIKKYVDQCEVCWKVRKRNMSPAPLIRFPIPEGPMVTTHLDLIGPMTKSLDDNVHCLSYIDAFSKFIIAVPLKDMKGVTIADALVTHVFSRFSPPKHLITDRAANLIQGVLKEVSEKLGIIRLPTTSYYPQCNGKSERSHKEIMRMVRSLILDDPLTWCRQLPLAVWAHNTSVSKATGCTPFFAVFLRDPNFPPASFFRSHRPYYFLEDNYPAEVMARLRKAYLLIRANLEKATESQKKYFDKKAMETKVREGCVVFLKRDDFEEGISRKLQMQTDGPYRVLKFLGPVTVQIRRIYPENKDSDLKTIHVNKLLVVPGSLRPRNQINPTVLHHPEQEQQPQPAADKGTSTARARRRSEGSDASAPNGSLGTKPEARQASRRGRRGPPEGATSRPPPRHPMRLRSHNHGEETEA